MSIINRPIAAAIALSSALFVGTPIAAQVAPAPQADAAAVDCARSAACITQIGDGNRATINQTGSTNSRANVVIDGDRNGTGRIAGQTVTGMRTVGPGPSRSAPNLVTREVTSGLVSQTGNNNEATVAIRGDRNDFHVGQTGNNNTATQLIGGDRNAAAGLQSGNRNELSQTQLGDRNTLYAAQDGNRNRATQLQVGTAEAVLLGAGSGSAAAVAAVFANGLGSASNNRILLEQNGNGNEANLTQIGSDHGIALRQQGNASIDITQMGSGRQIAVEQAANSRGVTIVQAGFGS